MKEAEESGAETAVFVYGTLKHDQPNHKVIASPPGVARFVGKATTVKKLCLVIGPPWGSPFLFEPSPTSSDEAEEEEMGHSILGEVWLVDSVMLHKLDEFEGCPFYYRRELIQVKYLEEEKEGEAGAAYVYLKNQVEPELWTLPRLAEYPLGSSYIPVDQRPPGWRQRYLQKTSSGQ
ncbi:Gamma-glutamylaminecyclotransferase [Balamuthia mandrillaris]